MHDTIAAAATPPGSGAVGIVRISGPGSKSVLSRLFLPISADFVNFRPRLLHRGRILDASGEPLDDVLAVFMPGPRTFTGEDIAEIHCHGGPAIVFAVLEAVLSLGARHAERGEFSRRAFLNGRMDLSQAEAVAEMIAAPTPMAARFALQKLDGMLGRKIGELRGAIEDVRRMICLDVDFSEEDLDFCAKEGFIQRADTILYGINSLLAGYERARPWREGVSAVLAGLPNVGKSSLLNAMLGRERALVSAIPGTTRDFLEETVLVDGMPIRLTDTAGLRENPDQIEALGIERGLKLMAEAGVLLLVGDSLQSLETTLNRVTEDQHFPDCRSKILLIWNKSDLNAPPQDFYKMADKSGVAGYVVVSALTGEGLENLGLAVKKTALGGQKRCDPASEDPAPNVRQAAELKCAAEAVLLFRAAMESGLPVDVCSPHIEEAASALAGITGLDSSDEMLDGIFSSFCIGK